ncbi:MAG: HDOD domain-containing protein [Pseudomonadota bacterium]
MSVLPAQQSDSAVDIIAKVNTLPPLPAVALQIIDKLGDEFVDGNVIADVVAQDPAIAGRLIGLANSAFFSLPTPVTDMRQVVNRVLGADSVRTLAFALATQQAFDTSRCAAFDAEGFWSHALRTAAYCKRLTAVLPKPEQATRDNAFILGLCNSLGLLVLAVIDPQPLNDILAEAEGFDAEQIDRGVTTQFGTSIASLTAALSKHWKMPDAIVATYERYAESVTDSDEQAQVLMTAASASKLDFSRDEADYVQRSRNDVVHRSATAFEVEETVVEIALTLTDVEAAALARNAAAMSGG